MASHWISLCLLLGAAAGCQPLDEGAALGEPFTLNEDGSPTQLDASMEDSQLELADGTRVSDACEATAHQARGILERSCARCHGGASPGARQGTPPFDSVLNTQQMVTMTSATVMDPSTSQPARFLVPGDPDHSRIYVRIQNAEMPPPDVIGLPPNPRPSVSDLSVLRHWIQDCIEQPAVPETQDDQDAGVDTARAPDTQHATY